MDNFNYKKYLAEGGIESKLEIRGSVLTKEDRKAIASMVIEESYQGITLTEAKTNESLKEDLKLNIEIYGSFKQQLIEAAKKSGRPLHEAAGAFGSALKILGNIKDILTATKVGADVSKWVESKIKNMDAVVSKLLDKTVPAVAAATGTNITPEGVKAFAEKQGQRLLKAINWLKTNLGYMGLAKLFATVRYYKVNKKGKGFIQTIKDGPTEEQVKCMVPAAKRVLAIIYAILVIAFLIKMSPAIMSFAGAVGTKGLTAAMMPIFTNPVSGLGIGKAAAVILAKVKTMFSVYSAGAKAADAVKYHKQAKQELTGELASDMNKAWNTCPLPGMDDA